MGSEEIGCEDVDWIQLAQDTVQWRDFVSTVMNFQFHKRRGLYEGVTRRFRTETMKKYTLTTINTR
jgi:hypothetical protein